MNKNNVLMVILLIIIIGFLAYLTFKPKDTENVYPVSVVTSSSQTTTINNQNGKDYQPVQVKDTKSTDTKSYTNSQYGFSLQYPSNWETPQGNFNGTYFELDTKESITVPFISYYPSVGKLSLNDFVNNAWGHSASNTPEQITVAGQKAYKFSYETTVNGRGQSNPLFNQQVGFQDTKGGFYVINLAVPLKDKDAGIIEFNQLLSSFVLVR